MPGPVVQATIHRRWDGTPAPAAWAVRLSLTPVQGGVLVEVAAPNHGDPPPRQPAGRTWRLWEHEVVEVFLLGEGERYTELELGPEGHWLLLELDGVRRISNQPEVMDVTFRRGDGDRWVARALVPWRHLPERVIAWNAYAIHGTRDAREHLALYAVSGETPDFHKLDCFGRLEPAISSGE